MRSSRTALLAVPAVALMLALVGCSGGSGGETGDAGGQEASPQEWFEANCPLKLSKTDSDGHLAMLQGPVAMNPQAIDVDVRESALKLYSYDESTASAEQAGELGSDTPFCFKAGQETVEGSDPDADYPEDITLYPVSMPDSDSVYIAGDVYMVDGISFDAEEKNIEDDGSESGGVMVVPDNLADIDGAIENVADDQVEYCDLYGSECGG